MKSGRVHLILGVFAGIWLSGCGCSETAEGAGPQVQQAGLREDPQLSLDLLRIAESISSPWVLTAGLGIALPLGERRAAEVGLAQAEARVSELRAREVEWDSLHALEESWIAWTAESARAEESERHARSLAPLAQRAQELLELGELDRSEAALFALEQERAALSAALQRGEARALELRVRACLGLAPGSELELVPAYGDGAEPGDSGPDELAARNPGLARLAAEYERSERALQLELERQLGELSLGPRFESDAGQDRFGLLGALPLPLWNANRRAIAHAWHERELARGAHEAEYEALVGRWAETDARLRSLEEAQRALEGELLSALRSQVELAAQSLELGMGSSLVLLESSRRLHEGLLERIELSERRAHARAEIAAWTGPQRVSAADLSEEPSR